MDKELEDTARLVVFGNAGFANNQFIGQYFNRDLLLNTVSWLVGEEELISIRPRTIRALAGAAHCRPGNDGLLSLRPDPPRDTAHCWTRHVVATAVSGLSRLYAAMSVPRTILMLTVLLGLGAYVYFVELPKARQDAEKPTILTFEKEAVDTLTLTYPEREISLQQTAAG